MRPRRAQLVSLLHGLDVLYDGTDGPGRMHHQANEFIAQECRSPRLRWSQMDEVLMGLHAHLERDPLSVPYMPTGKLKTVYQAPLSKVWNYLCRVRTIAKSFSTRSW